MSPHVITPAPHPPLYLPSWIAADLYLKEIEILRFELSMSVCSEELSTMVERVQRTSRNAGGQGASPAEGGSPLGGPDAARVVPAAPPGHMTGGESTFSNDASALPPTALPPVRGDDELSELGERISIADHLHVDTGAGAGQGYHGSDNTPPTHTPTGPDGLSPGPQSPVGGATPQTRPSTDQAQLAARAHSNALSLGLDEGQVNALLSAHRRSETMDSEWLASEGSNYVKKYRHLRTMSGLQVGMRLGCGGVGVWIGMESCMMVGAIGSTDPANHQRGSYRSYVYLMVTMIMLQSISILSPPRSATRWTSCWTAAPRPASRPTAPCWGRCGSG